MPVTQVGPPILPYATPGDAGVPDHYAPVEEMIDRRCRPKDIRIHFRKTAHAVEYFAKSMERRFSVERLGHVCDICGNVCDTFAAMNWSVEMPRKKLEVSLDSAPRRDLVTHHALCEKCHGQWSGRMKRLNWVRIVGCLVIVAGMIWLFIVRKWYSGQTITVILMPCVPLVIGAATIFLTNGIGRVATPKAIRKKLPPGLSPHALGALMDRNEGAQWLATNLPMRGPDGE
jgi:hypothetical protein